MSRPAPQSISELKVPNHSYDYFSGHQSIPFPSTIDSFCPTTAWWLSECAFCSYISNEEAIVSRMNSANFRNIEFCEANKLRAIIADLGSDTFIIFRGTLFNEMANVVTDLAVKRHEWPGGGRVHKGFHEGFLSLLPAVEKIMTERRGQRFWFSGHSLGAALATLFAAYFPVSSPLYTFGSPRIGDNDFQESLSLRSHRVVLGRDIVAALPPKPAYHHIAPSHRLTTDGKITFEEHEKHRTPKDILSEVRQSIKQPRDLARYFLTNNIIADHAPILYCIGLWNAIHAAQE